MNLETDRIKDRVPKRRGEREEVGERQAGGQTGK